MNRKITLTRRLTLEMRQDTPDASGGYKTVWVRVGEIWADVSIRMGREDFIAAEERPRVRYRMIVRAAPVGAPARPRPDQRLRDGTRIFDILTVAEHDAYGRYLEVLVEEGIYP